MYLQLYIWICLCPIIKINFKSMALLYHTANLLTIPSSIGYTPVYGILGK
jgi:hypothetical protein